MGRLFDCLKMPQQQRAPETEKTTGETQREIKTQKNEKKHAKWGGGKPSLRSRGAGTRREACRLSSAAPPAPPRSCWWCGGRQLPGLASAHGHQEAVRGGDLLHGPGPQHGHLPRGDGEGQSEALAWVHQHATEAPQLAKWGVPGCGRLGPGQVELGNLLGGAAAHVGQLNGKGERVAGGDGCLGGKGRQRKRKKGKGTENGEMAASGRCCGAFISRERLSLEYMDSYRPLRGRKEREPEYRTAQVLHRYCTLAGSMERYVNCAKDLPKPNG